ncbi:MAG TPA: hypothetical protein EYN66_07615 [Myxococcales bacterium]|nr:hypothetical protein [Myxococcales bacterium]
MDRRKTMLQKDQEPALGVEQEGSAIPGTGMLERNIQAITTVNRSLAHRLCFPTDLDHINRDNAEQITYRIHRNTYPLAADEGAAELILTTISDGLEILLFGAGTGVMLNGIRQGIPSSKVHIWDRDPAVLRTLFSCVDLSAEISDGSIQIHMGADFLNLLERKDELHFIAHPLLGQVYTAEAHLWEVGISDKVACVCTGGLLVPDLEDALRERGYSIVPIELLHVSEAEIDYSLDIIKPQLIAAINYIGGMERVAQRHSIPFLCWDMDPTTDRLAQPTGDSSHLHLFSCRPYLVESFKTQGFENVSFLPLAANPNRRRPLTLSPEEYSHYGAHVSFVGASLTSDAVRFQERLFTSYCEWRGTLDARPEIQEHLNQILAIQRQDFSVYRIPELMKEHMNDFLCHLASIDPALSPTRWVAEIAAMEKRLTVMANLGKFKPTVWGDSGWRALKKYGVRYMGGAGHMEELTRVYNASIINVDIGRIYQTDIPPMRLFDIMACGAFQLAEHSEAVSNLFEIGVEIETWKTIGELKSKVAWYLKHPSQAGKIAARGMAAVRKDHTVTQRLKEMMATSGTV